MKEKDQHPYQWEPRRHSVVRDEALVETLHEEGIAIREFLEPAQLEALRALYEGSHTLTRGDGGMFYTLYSQDLAYRQRIHEEAHAILRPTLDRWFSGYKNVVNSFVVKVPGPAREFAIHQDTTAMDELLHSPLTCWIPLWDVTPENGAMCVAPRTHRIFSPYRGISFPFPFAKITETVRNYLRPVPVRAGEAVIFDPRIIHNSLPNTTDRERVALICGIFPAEADFRICYKPAPDARIQIWQQEDDFTLKYPNFMHNCHDRPVAGKVVDEVEDRFPMIAEAEFVRAAESLGLEAGHALPEASQVPCTMIAEPDAVDRAPLACPAPAGVAEVRPERPGFLQRLFGRGR